MKTKHLKTMIETLTEKIQSLEKEVRFKEFEIDHLHKKLEDLEGGNGQHEQGKKSMFS